MKYIDADKLIAEIERLREPYQPHLSDFENGCREGRNDVLDDLHSFITSLQQEQPEVSAEHGWVARDMNNDLHCFSVKPVRSGAKWWDRDYLSLEVDGSLFGGLTWEDEPIEVELLFANLSLM